MLVENRFQNEDKNIVKLSVHFMDWPLGRKVLLLQHNSRSRWLLSASRSSRIYYLNFDTKLTRNAAALVGRNPLRKVQNEPHTAVCIKKL